MSVNDADADTFDHLTQMVTGPMSRGQPEEHEGASDVFRMPDSDWGTSASA